MQDRAFIYVDDFLNEVESKFKLLPIPDVVFSEAEGCFECKHLFSKTDYCTGNSVDCGKYEKQP